MPVGNQLGVLPGAQYSQSYDPMSGQHQQSGATGTGGVSVGGGPPLSYVLGQGQLANQKYGLDIQSLLGQLQNQTAQKGIESTAATAAGQQGVERYGIGQQAQTAAGEQGVQKYGIEQQAAGEAARNATNQLQIRTQDLTQRYGIDTQKQIQDAVNATNQLGIQVGSQTSRYQADVAARAAELPAQLQQQRFQTVFPFLQQMLGQVGMNAQRIGGDTLPPQGGAPSSVLDPAQVEQQVNAARAGIEQQTAGQLRDTERQLAGRGLGSQSPLAQAIQAQLQGASIGGQADQERQIRLGAAQQNAQQATSSATLAEQIRANQAQEQIQRLAPYFGQQNALIAALSGLA